MLCACVARIRGWCERCTHACSYSRAWRALVCLRVFRLGHSVVRPTQAAQERLRLACLDNQSAANADASFLEAPRACVRCVSPLYGRMAAARRVFRGGPECARRGKSARPKLKRSPSCDAAARSLGWLVGWLLSRGRRVVVLHLGTEACTQSERAVSETRLSAWRRACRSRRECSTTRMVRQSEAVQRSAQVFIARGFRLSEEELQQLESALRPRQYAQKREHQQRSLVPDACVPRSLWFAGGRNARVLSLLCINPWEKNFTLRCVSLVVCCVCGGGQISSEPPPERGNATCLTERDFRWDHVRGNTSILPRLLDVERTVPTDAKHAHAAGSVADEQTLWWSLGTWRMATAPFCLESSLGSQKYTHERKGRT